MTDKEIIKALECCTYNITQEKCAECPLYGGHCTTELARYTLDLINRQKAEVERFQAEADQIAEDYSNLVIEKDELFDEAEKLIKKAKAEAVKEFADRLHDEVFIMSRTPEGDIDFNDFEVLLRKIQKETVVDE